MNAGYVGEGLKTLERFGTLIKALQEHPLYVLAAFLFGLAATIWGWTRSRAERQREKEREARLKRLEARAERRDAALPGLADRTFQSTIARDLESLAKSSDLRKRAALDRAEDDPEGAAADLEALAAKQEAVAAKAERKMREERAATHRQAGALWFLTNTDKALAAYEKAAALTPEDPEAQNQLGHLYLRLGRLGDAEQAYRRVLETAGANDKAWEAAALGNLGVVAQTRGDLDAAEEYYQRSLAISEAEGMKELSANQLGNLGAVAKQRGDAAEACRLWARSVALYREVGVPHMVEQVSGWMREAGCAD